VRLHGADLCEHLAALDVGLLDAAEQDAHVVTGARLVEEYRKNPNMVVRIRADRAGKFELPVNIIEVCRRNGITRFDIGTEPQGGR
jgi:biopolymer transport protein ExbD